MAPSSAGALTLGYEGPLATLTFNRPEVRNALDSETWRALPELVARAASRAETRVLVVRGAGGHFAAGADIGEFDRVFADRTLTLAYAEQMAAATAALEAVGLPVVAVIDGLCIGAGVAVALACDLRLASAEARFAVTPAKLGLMYSLADTRRLVAAVGPSAARDLLFTGRMIDAAAALRMRLVDEAAPPAQLDVLVADRARQMAEVSAWSIAKAKSVISLIAAGQVAESAETRGWFADAPAGDDYREGLAAFRARRRPNFTARPLRLE